LLVIAVDLVPSVLPHREDNVSVSFPLMPTSETGTTRIQLCGRLKVDFEGRHVTPALRGRQGRVLLAYLVINRGRSVSRDELIEAIWPDISPADPAAALRTQLSRLRSALGPDAVAGRDTVELRLPENTWIDVEAAERAIRVAHSALKASDWKDAWAHAHIALNIAGRPFLAGFEAPWVEEVQWELEELELRSREVIARAGIGLGGSELAGAERSARALIRAAPFRESGYLNLMQTLVASGNTAEALRTYDDLRKLLARELGSAPSAEIQALHRKLLSGHATPPAPVDKIAAGAGPADSGAGTAAPPLPSWLQPRPGTPFIGRSEELGHLSQLWVETRHGTRHIALLAGEPGVGKTRLVTEFAQRVHGSGATVLHGRADEEATLTYQPFIEALRHWATSVPLEELEKDLGSNAAVLASLAPEIAERLSAPSPRAVDNLTRDRLFDAVTTTLSAIAARRPLLLALDDLHWADPASVLMLRHIARSGGGALMVVAAYRPTEPSPVLTETLADLGREKLFERIALTGLSAADVTEMVAAIRGGGAEPELAEAIREDTGGNPFLIEALVNNMDARDRRQVPGAQRREQIYAHGIPDPVHEAVAHRIAELGPATAETLEIAATVGSEFDAELVIEVSELSGDEILGSLEASVWAGLLTDVPDSFDRYAFSHALFRQTVYAATAKRRRATFHERIADTLERRHGSDPRHVAELARHYSESGPAASPKALEYSVRAGAGALGALSFEEAVTHYTQALSALDTSGQTEESLRCEILLALGEAEWRMGDASASRETLSRAFRLAQRGDDDEALGRAALGFCGFGWDRHRAGDPEAVNLLRSALARQGLPAALRARLLARLAAILQSAQQNEEAERLSLEALDVASSTADAEAMAAALIGRWHAVSGPDGPRIRAELVHKLRTIAEELRNRDLELQVATLQVIASLELGNFAELDVAIAEHARLADRMKQPLARIRSRSFQAMRALVDGRYGDAERLVGATLELGASAHPSSAIELSVIELYMLYMETNRLAELEEPVRNLAVSDETTPGWKIGLTYLLSEIEKTEEARALFEGFGEDDFASIPRDSTELSALAFLAMTAVRLRDPARTELLLDRLLPFRGHPVVIGNAAAYAGTASYYLGLLAIELDRQDAAVEYLEEDVSLNQRAGALPWLARSRYELTRVMAARASNGDAEQAGELLAEAGRTAEQLGMTALLQQMGGTDAKPSRSRA
jgi:DNA-binding SARP family transcriptional activator/tetratricopeptide (TPR) repeat protein